MLALGAAAACERVAQYTLDPGDGAPRSPAEARDRVLASAARCATELHTDLAAAAASLEEATHALADEGTSEAAATARAAWLSTATLWETSRMVAVGPAAPVSVAGGAALGEVVDAWPVASRCLVDQALVSKAYEAADFATTSLVSMRGLATLDYLLFYEGNQNACDDSVTINADGSWSALSTDERSRRRAAYAAVVARDVAKAAKGMADGWSEGFADALASGAAPFSSPDDAVGALSDGLFYLDKALKDRKLGQPLGLVNCEDKSCPESVQGAHSRRGVALARANLEGARRLLLGCGEGTLGFTSLLGSLGADDVAEKVVAQLDDAAAAAEALGSDDLAALLESNRAGVVELYDRVRWLGDTLETEWTTVLGVTIPSTVQGDND